MATLDAFIPSPRLREVDSVDVGIPLDAAFRALESLDLGSLPIAKALFAARAIPERLAGRDPEPWDLRMKTIMASTHGFRLLHVEPGRGFAVGAIGRVWEPVIPFVDVDPAAYAAYAEPGEAKVCWELRADPVTSATSRITMEVRVTTTDEASWPRFTRYFALIGPFSRLIRRLMLARVARSLGTAADAEAALALPGDALIPDALAGHTDAITIDAAPARVWPWLLQMGADRAGWYAYDWLDNAGRPSLTTLDPALTRLELGQTIPVLPGSKDGFTVAAIEPERALVLAVALDLDTGTPITMAGPMPPRFWRVTWAFVLEPTASGGTRLLVRVRGDWAPEHLVWRARAELTVHHFMERAQLRHLKERAESHPAPERLV